MKKETLICGLIGLLGISGGVGYLLGKRKSTEEESSKETLNSSEDEENFKIVKIVINKSPELEKDEKEYFKPRNTLSSIKLALSLGKKIQTKSGEPVQIRHFYGNTMNLVTVDVKSMGGCVSFTPREFWDVFEAVD